MILRQHYMEMLKMYRNVQLVKIWMVVRCCRKSTILEMLRNDQKSGGISDNHINFARYTSEDMDVLTDKDMYNAIKKPNDGQRALLHSA